MFPTWQAVIKDLVPAQRLRAAVAVSSVRFNLSRVLAPALAGGLLSIAGPAVCLAVSAGGSLGIILVTLAIRPRKLATSQPVSWWAAIGQGLDYARHEVDVRLLLLVTAGFGLLALPYQALLPAYTQRQLGLGPDGLGTLLTAVGVGGIIGALITGSKYTNNREYRAMGVFTVVTGLGLLILGFAPTLATALLGLAIIGLGSFGFLTASQSTIQLIVPDRLVGRGDEPVHSLSCRGHATGEPGAGERCRAERYTDSHGHRRRERSDPLPAATPAAAATGATVIATRPTVGGRPGRRVT